MPRGHSVTRSLLCLAACLVVAACSTPHKEPNVNLAGYPPEFRAGYLDGCDAARRGTTRKDEQRFKHDAQYASGWRDGHDICAKRAR
jgi:hypothetical protein